MHAFFLTLLVAVAFSVMWIVRAGWTLDGIGPAALVLFGASWHAVAEWLRDRSWRAHRHLDFVPPTQGIHIIGVLGFALTSFPGMAWAFCILMAQR